MLGGGGSVAEESAFGCVADGLVGDVAGWESHEVFHDEESSFVAHLVEASSAVVAVVVFGFLCLEPGVPFVGCASPAHVYDGGCGECGCGWRVCGGVCVCAFWPAELVGVDEYAVSAVGESGFVGFGSRPAGRVSSIEELLVDGVGILLCLWNVFYDNFGGLYGANDVHAGVEEAAACSVESGLLSGAGEVLAGEAEGDGAALVVEECGVTDVIVDGGCWVVMCEYLACWLVVVAYGVDVLRAECGLEGELKAAVA